jgi:positive regulator of sigma E activity
MFEDALMKGYPRVMSASAVIPAMVGLVGIMVGAWVQQFYSRRLDERRQYESSELELVSTSSKHFQTWRIRIVYDGRIPRLREI